MITGDGSGIGAETAHLFAHEGARFLVTDMNEENGATVAAELGGAGVWFDHLYVVIGRPLSRGRGDPARRLSTRCSATGEVP